MHSTRPRWKAAPKTRKPLGKKTKKKTAMNQPLQNQTHFGLSELHHVFWDETAWNWCCFFLCRRQRVSFVRNAKSEKHRTNRYSPDWLCAADNKGPKSYDIWRKTLEIHNNIRFPCLLPRLRWSRRSTRSRRSLRSSPRSRTRGRKTTAFSAHGTAASCTSRLVGLCSKLRYSSRSRSVPA